jgi:hypothetical protein
LKQNIFGPNFSRFLNHSFQAKHFGPNYSHFFNYSHSLHIFVEKYKKNPASCAKSPKLNMDFKITQNGPNYSRTSPNGA